LISVKNIAPAANGSGEATKTLPRPSEDTPCHGHALEQEMIAKAQEMRAKVIEAEAQIPLAISEAFKSGNLGVMDYMKYKNIMADTAMRDSISGDENKKNK
jgi:uncharacterized protein YqfA (UPF0365 family)